MSLTEPNDINSEYPAYLQGLPKKLWEVLEGKVKGFMCGDLCVWAEGEVHMSRATLRALLVRLDETESRADDLAALVLNQTRGISHPE